jgi:4-amino-4-deoxy-L-arabinose transferase-like glycosyltransferase
MSPSSLNNNHGFRSSFRTVRKSATLKYLHGLLPFLLIIGIFVFAGLTDHDPWKADEAYVFGMVHSMLQSGDWVVPMVAGEPFMEKPPLYYWVAAAFVRLLKGWLSEPDAARMASGFFMLITCSAMGQANRLWWGKGTGHYAPLLVIACLGTLTQTHMMMPDVPLLTGFALAAWGFARIHSQAKYGGVVLGTAVGIAFLSKGIIGPGVIAFTAVLLPLCFRQWRSRSYLRAMGSAFITSLPWLTIWPAALYARSPTLFMEWFWENNLGRFFGFSPTLSGTEHLPWFWTQTIPWFTFPALPLAIYTLWKKREVVLQEPAAQYSVIAFAVFMLMLTVSSAARAVYALPLLVPLAILGSPGAMLISVKLERLLAGTAMVVFGLLAALLWTGWAILIHQHSPPDWPWLLRLLPSEFVPDFNVLTMIVAAMITLTAVLAFWKSYTLPARGLTSWVIGMTLVWSLLSTLWMPWLDYAKSYRSVFTSMPMPAETNCIASVGLGEGERAMLKYFTGRITLRREVVSAPHCDTFLVQGYVPSGTRHLDLRGWEMIWEGARPGDTWQRFWLFRAKNFPATGAGRYGDNRSKGVPAAY